MIKSDVEKDIIESINLMLGLDLCAENCRELNLLKDTRIRGTELGFIVISLFKKYDILYSNEKKFPSAITVEAIADYIISSF